MKFEEIIPLARKNKKIRCVDWEPEEFIICIGINFYDQDNEIYNLFAAIEILDCEWEIFKEKVKYYPPLVKGVGNICYTINTKFKDLQEAKKYFVDEKYIFELVGLLTEFPELIEERYE